MGEGGFDADVLFDCAQLAVGQMQSVFMCMVSYECRCFMFVLFCIMFAIELRLCSFSHVCVAPCIWF
jgi:hypothetical protein